MNFVKTMRKPLFNQGWQKKYRTPYKMWPKECNSIICRKEFKRLVAVANPMSGVDFLDEVSYFVSLWVGQYLKFILVIHLLISCYVRINQHLGACLDLDMTLKTLQMFVTHWWSPCSKWNGCTSETQVTYLENHYGPLRDVKEKELEK